jgi:uncharacterized membrane protein
VTDEPKGRLQFDRAEFEQPPPARPTCAACGQAIWSVYYAVNGQVLCERCKTEVELHASQGSRAGRFLRAAVYGLGAGALGAGVWYGVRATTGYELGLIAIGVGFFVGAAVRKGSNGRGGWRYQALAIFLTYASIVSTYVPEIMTGLMKGADQDSQAATTTTPAPASGLPSPAAELDASAVTVSPAVTVGPAAVTVAPPDPGQGSEQLTPGKALVAVSVFLAFVVVIAFAAPFLGGFENIMGIFIIGIALYEAWKMNKKASLEITGPHVVGVAPEPPAAPLEPGRG